MPLWCNKQLPEQSASIIIAFGHAFLGGRERCACFRNNITFFRPSSYFLWSIDFDNQQHFVLNCLWFIVCHWWAGIFVNNISPLWLDNRDVQGRNEVRCARGKIQVWRPHVRTGLSKANVLFSKIAYDIIVTFGPRSDSAPGELCPLAPLVTSLVVCNRKRKMFRK